MCCYVHLSGAKLPTGIIFRSHRHVLPRWVDWCCSVAQLCPTLCNPMDSSTPGLPVLHCLPEFRLMRTESVMPSNHLILCCPLLFLPSIFPNIRVFFSESALHIRWSKYWSSMGKTVHLLANMGQEKAILVCSLVTNADLREDRNGKFPFWWPNELNPATQSGGEKTLVPLTRVSQWWKELLFSFVQQEEKQKWVNIHPIGWLAFQWKHAAEAKRVLSVLEAGWTECYDEMPPESRSSDFPATGSPSS